jgi:hypothetical protein
VSKARSPSRSSWACGLKPGRGLWRCSIEHLQRPPALTLSRGSARELITIAFGSKRRAPPRPSSPPTRRQSARAASPLWPPRTHRVGLSHTLAQRLALGAPLDYGSDTGVSGDLRIALRMSLSAEFVRYGRRSERCRVVDYGHVCRSREDVAPRAPECVHRHVLCWNCAPRSCTLVRTIHTVVWDTSGACSELALNLF